VDCFVFVFWGGCVCVCVCVCVLFWVGLVVWWWVGRPDWMGGWCVGGQFGMRSNQPMRPAEDACRPLGHGQLAS
jgi:hypothetical protein